MSTVEKYASKDDIIYFIQMFNEDFDEDKVDDRLLKIVNAKIDAWIIEHGMRPTNITDRFNLLWSAAVCMSLELLCYSGDLSWSTGDVALEKLNRTTYAYQRWQPMFFFATGASDPFKGLLPHETYRMMAYAYVEAYCRDDFFNEYGSPYPIPRVTRDDTSRGWGWNLKHDYKKIADEMSSHSAGVTGYEDWYEYDYYYDEGPL